MKTKVLTSLWILIFAVSCSGPLAPVNTSTPPAPTLTPVYTPETTDKAISPYAVDGEYAVAARAGMIEVQAAQVPLFIWYPIVNGPNGSAHGPYPLVIFSPGATGIAIDYAALILRLASHGFVIISGNRIDESMEYDSKYKGLAARPVITLEVIKFAKKLNAPGGDLPGMIDMDHVAVMGHSSGGWTALMGGGARYSLSWCPEHQDFVTKMDEWGGIGYCIHFTGHQKEIAEMLGLKSVPTGLWPQVYDPGVDAVIAIAPNGDIWGKDFEGVASVKVPTMIMVGSNDEITPIDLWMNPMYEHLGSQNKSLAVFQSADHMFPEDNYFVTQTEQGQEFLHLVTAFLLAHLKGDAEAAKALEQANINFKDVIYKVMK